MIFNFLTFFDFLESILHAIWDYSGRMLKIETPQHFECFFLKNRSEMSKKSKSKKFWVLQIISSTWFPNHFLIPSKSRNYFQKNFLWFFLDFGADLGGLRQFWARPHGFRRKNLMDFHDFPKSRRPWEAVTSSLVVRSGCPDTLRLSHDSRSFVFVVSGRPRPAQTILIRNYKMDFSKMSMHHPTRRGTGHNCVDTNAATVN